MSDVSMQTRSSAPDVVLAPLPAEPVVPRHAPRGFRPDIEGLRAIAITSVVLYHAGVRQLSGGFVGVDLFFVLSGFLISGLLVREIEKTGRVHLANFWARRARRLLPAASLVLLVTVAVSLVALPTTVRTDTAYAVTAATLYAANWFFAANSLDYLAAEDAPSPVLHFWSLGVEEQFYLVWPLLLLLLGIAAHRFGWPLRRIFGSLAAIIWVSSFAISVHMSAVAQPTAFFGSPSRFWQLATGALLAIGTHRIALAPAKVRGALQFAGLGALSWSIAEMGRLVEGGQVYPGLLALVPTLATAALVAGGARDRMVQRTVIDRALMLPPMQWLGGLSYSWYLWHWPFLVLWQAHFGEASLVTRLTLVGIALLVAWGTHHLFENPIRFARALQSSPGDSLRLGAFLMVLTVTAASALSLTDARHLDAGTVQFRPLPSVARDDRAAIYRDNCVVEYHDIAQPSCIYGDKTADRRIVLIGDSHAASMFPAVNAAAQEFGYQLDVRVKLSCNAASVDTYLGKFGRVFTECIEWRTRQIADLRANPPAAVVVISDNNPPENIYANGHVLAAEQRDAAWVRGMAKTLRLLQSTGTSVIVLRDNPRVPGIIVDCVAEHMKATSTCDFPRAFGLPEPALDLQAAALVNGVRTLDMSDQLCNAVTCFAVTNNVLAWQRGNHLTATYARSIAPMMKERLRPLLPS